jgi:hypothetical protein
LIKSESRECSVEVISITESIFVIIYMLLGSCKCKLTFG